MGISFLYFAIFFFWFELRLIVLICDGMKVETLLMYGTSIEDVILNYMRDSGIKNLVLGSSSMGWIRRYVFCTILKFFSCEKMGLSVIGLCFLLRMNSIILKREEKLH